VSFVRVRAFLVIGLLTTAALVVAVVAVVRDTQRDAAAAGGCPAGATPVNLVLPDRADQVRVRVLNGTRAAGVAERTSEEFKNRGFLTQKPAGSSRKFAKVAIVEYGPKTVGAAQWVRAYFLGEAQPQYLATRTTDVIDIVIGDEFRQLATNTEVSQSLAQLGEPTLPPGTCPALAGGR
jgi:hypothetical protein